jgi:hypothetical protein
VPDPSSHSELDPSRKISAQVVLKPADEAAAARVREITVETLPALLPAAHAGKVVAAALVEWGFTVGPLVANSLSIEGSAETFGKTFKVQLRRSEKAGEGVEVCDPNGQPLKPTNELPFEALPRHVADQIKAVTFSPAVIFD